MSPRIGSLCSGYGGLDLAVMDAVPGATVAWHAQYDPDDKHQYAARIRWPGVPNLGDITATDYTTVEPVDVLTAGWPCQDMSLAGLGAGLMPGTRSGLWYHVARAIAALRPSIVFLENVRSLTSARAHSNVELCPWCMGDLGDGPTLRALGAVLGDLADIGFDAEWLCLPASDVGAPHQRWRAFVLAWPADAPRPGLEGWRQGWSGGGNASDAHGGGRGLGARLVGGQRAEEHLTGHCSAVVALGVGRSADAEGDGRHQRRAEPARQFRGSDAALGGGHLATDAPGLGTGEPADEAIAVAGSRRARPVPSGRGMHAPADTNRLGRERNGQPRNGGGQTFERRSAR